MKSSKKILIIILTATILVILGVSMASSFSAKNTVSPNILYLTQPVNSFTGTVTSTSNASLTLTREINPTDGNNNKTTPAEKISYVVKITKDTKLHRQTMPYDYQEKTGIPLHAATPALSDIKTGDVITVQTKADLRVLAKNEFTASTLEMAPVQKLITGTIVTVGKDKIQISTLPVFPMSDGSTDFNEAVDKQQIVDIHITGRSRIVQTTLTNGLSDGKPPVEIPVQSLRPAIPIRIYLEKSIEDKPLTLIRGEVESIVNVSSTPPVVDKQVSPLPQAEPTNTQPKIETDLPL